MFAGAAILRRLGAQPLYLAQASSSAAGALAMVMAATVMSPRDFTTFSLLILVSITAMGAVRAGLFQPALIETRNNRDAHVRAGSALLGAACTAGFSAVAAAVLGENSPWWLFAIGATSMLPVVVEWLRIRGMAMDYRWEVARGDTARLVVTMAGPLVLWRSADVAVFFVFINLTYATTFGYLWYRLPRVTKYFSTRQHWRPASSQLLDYVVGQAVSTFPLLVLGALGPSSYLGGVRLAQTLLGPLNLVFAAATVNLMSDGATRQSHSDDADLVMRGRRLAWWLGTCALVLVTVLLGFLLLSNFSFRGADNRSLIVGVALVGLLAVASGFAGIDAIVMRLLGHHTIPTTGRVLLVVVTFIGYATGYAVGGVDLSLVVGFVTATIVNPLVFVVPAIAIYRGHVGRGHAMKDQAGETIPS